MRSGWPLRRTGMGLPRSSGGIIRTGSVSFWKLKGLPLQHMRAFRRDECEPGAGQGLQPASKGRR
jgi:hypothetical protein